MAQPEYMSDMGVVEPHKSLLAERPDPALVPDLETAQATEQGSTLHEHEPNTHTLYYQLLHMNQQLIRSRHVSVKIIRNAKVDNKSFKADSELCTCVFGFRSVTLVECLVGYPLVTQCVENI